MRAAAALLIAILAGCSSVTDVVPTGANSYMVGSTAHGGFTGDAEVKALALRRANEFCAGKGKTAEVTSSQSTGTQGWTPQNSEVNFSCK